MKMLCCMGIMIAATACANKEVVKKDEPLGTTHTAASMPAIPFAEKTIKPPQQENKIDKPAAAPVESARQAPQAVKVAAATSDLEKIFFDLDSSNLSNDARQVLVKDAETMMQLNNLKVTIEGHCDERGSAEYNLALGERRARAAMQYLITLGVPAAKLSVVSYGKEKPAVVGNTESAWTKNRRDEFVVQR
ncbi:peptidoglycan-associated lipoprotein Pal [Geobacter chapellei]|uniref:Peptidoglycan-associated lipoprotein n=2 Tax=Pelotalea chapellei TaxID=44671 RepID=A0ABS5U3T4_9BACT|nr:peptidoglycan-associated lipoprotein Pal [Pelotalea chapellei]